MEIKIKYENDVERIQKIEIGDWIDLRCSSKEPIEIKKGDYCLLPLGVAMQLPPGYEANVLPRSSTCKNFGIILANGMGVIDESYCGDEDYWRFPAIAIRDTTINFNDRICQFRINKKMDQVTFVEVESLGNENRGGIGSTGTN